jgi:hypothetical protein
MKHFIHAHATARGRSYYNRRSFDAVNSDIAATAPGEIAAKDPEDVAAAKEMAVKRPTRPWLNAWISLGYPKCGPPEIHPTETSHFIGLRPTPLRS